MGYGKRWSKYEQVCPFLKRVKKGSNRGRYGTSLASTRVCEEKEGVGLQIIGKIKKSQTEREREKKNKPHLSASHQITKRLKKNVQSGLQNKEKKLITTPIRNQRDQPSSSPGALEETMLLGSGTHLYSPPTH